MARKTHLIDGDGPLEAVDRAAIEERLKTSTFFWLDLHGPDETDVALLNDVFHLHSLAVEDAEHFGQRAKLDEYDGFVLLVAFGANADEDNLVEVHCFLSENYLVTVHHDDCPSFADVRTRIKREHAATGNGALLLYYIVDALTDSFFPVLAEFDDRIDALEDRVFEKPDDSQLQELFGMKRTLVSLRKAISPQRDLFARIATGVVAIPGLTTDVERYYRDVYDHMIRISDLVDSYRDLMSGAMDVYLSTVSNRLNDVMKKLTIIATIFLPLSWLTGYFGQNLGFMVGHIGGVTGFLVLGVGAPVAMVMGLLWLFKKRGWL